MESQSLHDSVRECFSCAPAQGFAVRQFARGVVAVRVCKTRKRNAIDVAASKAASVGPRGPRVWLARYKGSDA
jgi:hypothetical protein